MSDCNSEKVIRLNNYLPVVMVGIIILIVIIIAIVALCYIGSRCDGRKSKNCYMISLLLILLLAALTMGFFGFFFIFFLIVTIIFFTSCSEEHC
jgi:hypothetical protein